MKKLFYVFLVFMCFFARVDFATTVTSFTLGNISWTMGSGQYSPFESTAYTQSIPFNVNVSGTSTPNYFLSVSDGGQTSFLRLASNGSNTLSYNVYKDSQLSNILKDSAHFVISGNVLTGQVSSPNSGSYSHTIYLNIPAQQIKRSGSYTNTLTVALYEGDWTDIPSAVLVQSKDILITVPVASSVRLALDSNDFDHASNISKTMGTLYDNIESIIAVYVQSNDGYKLKMSSLNGGVMKTGLTPETPLAYQFYVDNTLVTLATANVAVEVLQNSSATTTSGQSYTGKLKIPSIAHVFSGTYADTLTFTVEAL